MGKRGRLSSSSDESSVRKTRKGAVDVEDWELRLRSTEAQDHIAKCSWLDPIMSLFDQEMAKYRSPEKFMCSEWPDIKLSEWARTVEAHFPSITGIGYMTDDSSWVPGRKLFRAWEVSWKLNSGNSGFIDLAKFRNLLMLVLAFGPETDPEIAGTHIPIISKPDERFSDGSGCFTGAPAPEGIMSPGIHGVHTTKAYKRFLAINMAIALMIKSGTIEHYKKTYESTPGFLTRFAVMHGLVIDKTGADLLDLNRGAAVR